MSPPPLALKHWCAARALEGAAEALEVRHHGASVLPAQQVDDDEGRKEGHVEGHSLDRDDLADDLKRSGRKEKRR